MANTSLMNRVAIHMTAESSLPTLPASPGSNISVANWGSAGFSTIRSTNFDAADEFDIDEETLNFAVEEKLHRTSAPISHGVDEVIMLGRTLEDFEIVLYDFSESLLAFDSSSTNSSSKITWNTAQVNRTIAVEINNIGIVHFPKCYVRFSNIEMGAVEDQVARCTMMFTPLNVSGFPGGFDIEYY